MHDVFSQALIVFEPLFPRFLPLLVLPFSLSLLTKLIRLLRAGLPEPKINRSKQISDLTYSEIENGSFDLDKSVALWADFYSDGGD